MIKQIFKLFKKQYQTLNKIELSAKNLIHNYQYLSSFDRKLKVAPVLKSNAYGHGILEIAKILDSQKASFFCVDSLFEAYQLLKAKIKTPILIMGYTNPENLKVKKLPFSFAVYDRETLKVLDKYQPGAKIHIKVDTGMHRLGVPIDDLPDFLKELKNYPHLQVEGLMSHLAMVKGPLFQSQLKNFQKAKELVKKSKFNPQWFHLSASSGLINTQARKKILQISNLARCGIALYGIGSNPQLKPVLKLTTHLAQIKTLVAREKVGYDGTFVAKKKMVLGVLPIGYFDGVDRRLSNLGFTQVKGVECPIVGKVSMNITTIDLSNVQNPQIGEGVVIYSDNPNHPNSIEGSAQLCQTIPYDFLVHLTSSMKRVVI